MIVKVIVAIKYNLLALIDWLINLLVALSIKIEYGSVENMEKQYQDVFKDKIDNILDL